MVGREPVLEANLDLAGLAGAGIRKRENLLAPANRAGWFLLLSGVAISGLGVLLQQQFLVLFAVAAGGFYGCRADFANHHLSAVVVRFRALVGLVGPMLNAENLMTTVAVEGEEIELVAIGELAVSSQIRESFCSSRHLVRNLNSIPLESLILDWQSAPLGRLIYRGRYKVGRSVGRSGVGLGRKPKPGLTRIAGDASF